METASWKKNIPHKFIYSSIRTPKSSEKNVPSIDLWVKIQLKSNRRWLTDQSPEVMVVSMHLWFYIATGARKDGHGVYG